MEKKRPKIEKEARKSSIKSQKIKKKKKKKAKKIEKKKTEGKKKIAQKGCQWELDALKTIFKVSQFYSLISG